MSEIVMRSRDDTSALRGLLLATDFTKPKKIVIKDLDRSSDQNRLLHAMLTDIANQVEHAGKKWDVLIWKRLLTAAWLREAGENPQFVPSLDGRGVDVIYERTSKLTVKQCASLLEWITAFAAEHQVRMTAKDHWGGRYDQ
ncbi:recombination protein NinB [Pseudomonas petrae]|uniref:recombination protein NinB n=1 Tax=Pseudomonas petrae TaxID=2912190 RepID=UPI001F15E320|nr:recombination protein NinB [Pseudomonas petrae]MCF7536173.1 recombination protein NinB [Pseudomonas petrae]